MSHPQRVSAPATAIALSAILAWLPNPCLADHHAATPAPHQASAPVAVVDALQGRLLAYMGSAASTDLANQGAAVATLNQAVLDSHDFAYISRIVLGRAWRVLEDADRERFIESFTALSLATYARRFAEFAGERFTITDERDGSFGQRRVSAELITPAKRHSFDYLLRQSGEQWRIVNIIVDGVSDLALKRAEYSTLITESGFEGLIEELERQRLALAERSSEA
ncbi:MAG: ABC transporter substrate-binding protein [Pseudomonadota bacterium]